MRGEGIHKALGDRGWKDAKGGYEPPEARAWSQETGEGEGAWGSCEAGGGEGPRAGGRGPPEGGTHVAGGGGGRGRCLGDGAQLFLREALSLVEGGARVENRVLDEDAHGAKHEGQEQMHVDVIACAMQPPAGRATARWVGSTGARAGRTGVDGGVGRPHSSAPPNHALGHAHCLPRPRPRPLATDPRPTLRPAHLK